MLLASSCTDAPEEAEPSTTDAPTGQSGTISALSYNVAGLPAGLSGSTPDANSSQISPLLNDYDLVLLQEDWGDPQPGDHDPAVLDQYAGFDLFHDEIVGAADHPHQSTPAKLPLSTDDTRPSALLADGLNRLSRTPFGEITRQPWADCEGIIDGASDCLAFKGFSVATHELAPGVEVHVYNLHGEAGAGERDQALQAEGYQQLAEFIASHSEGAAIILGGDTNLHTGDGHPDGAGDADAEIWNQLLGDTDMTDVCTPIDCGSDDGRIDKFAYRSTDRVQLTPTAVAYLIEPFVDSAGTPLSDHDPLHVDFDWSANTGG